MNDKLKWEPISKTLGGKKPTAQNLYIHLKMREFISNEVKKVHKESR